MSEPIGPFDPSERMWPTEPIGPAWTDGPPRAHTCDRVKASPKCPGCQHQSQRFPALLFGFLDLVNHSDPTDETEVHYHAIIDELTSIGMLSAMWYHCACIATQLCTEPLKIDREGSWGDLMRQDRQQADKVLGLCDELLRAAATDDRDGALLITREMLGLDHAEQDIVHLGLAEVMDDQVNHYLSIWQQVVHRSMMNDVWMAIGHPHEVLTAARISGALLDRDTDQVQQLMNRATLAQKIHTLVMLWARGAASHLGEGTEYALLRMKGDSFDAILDTHADLDLAETAHERAFLIAERMIRAMARDDADLGATVPEALKAEPGILRLVIMSVVNFHSQTMQARWGELVREHQELAAELHGAGCPCGHDGDGDGGGG